MPKNLYNLVAFQRALDLVASVYELSSGFPSEERYGLIAQIRRASCGVCSHIAEGQGRLTFGEWRQFLSQARGSLYEVEAQVMIAQRLGFISATDCEPVRRRIRDCAAALSGFIRWVQSKERQRQPGNSATRRP
jgi:four helix bundle protein